MKIYLTNMASDISGYKLALIDERNPGATSTVATALTTIAAGSHSLTGQGTTTSMTLTASGSAAKWITKPFRNAITIPNQRVGVNYWAKVTTGVSHHAAAWFKLATASNAATARAAFVSYQTGSKAGQGSKYLAVQTNTAVTSTVGQRRYITSNVGSSNVAIAAGDRLIITGKVVNALNQATASLTQVAGSLTLDFDGNKDGADGDTWIEIPTNAVSTVAAGAIPTKRQQPNDAVPSFKGNFSRAFYQEMLDKIDALVASGEYSMDTKVLALYQELAAERDNL